MSPRSMDRLMATMTLPSTAAAAMVTTNNGLPYAFEFTESRIGPAPRRTPEAETRVNVTDVEDKIIKAAHVTGEPPMVLAARFTADAYRCLGASLDTHRIDPATIRVPTTLFGVREDVLAPPALLREYAALAPHCEYVEISSIHGHDAFLKEESSVGKTLRNALGDVA